MKVSTRKILCVYIYIYIPLYHGERCSHLGRCGETQGLLHCLWQSLVFESMKELYHCLL